MKSLIRKILKEETTNRFIEKVANYIKIPYFKNMESLGLTEDEYEMVLSKVYGQPVTINGNNVYDQYGNRIYFEDSDGNWIKRGYDINGKVIYYETSSGYIEEFDQYGNRIYSVDSNGRIIDNR